MFSSRKMQQAAGKHLMLAASHFMHRVPLRAALGFGRWLGSQAPRLSARHFRRVCTDIALAFPEFTPAQVDDVARRFYRRIAESVAEFLRLPYQTSEEIHRFVALEGMEHLDDALAWGKGVVLISGHIGNWELMGTMMGLSPYPTTVIAREQADNAMTQFINRIREKHGLRVLSMADPRGGLRVLRRNECLGMISDLNANVPACFINFLGRPASTFTGAAFMARTMGAAILPVFIDRLPDNTHCMRYQPAILPADTGDKERDLFYTTMRIHYVIGEEVRRRPHDWFWLLNRWKTRPEDVEHPEKIFMEHRDLTPAQVAEILAPVKAHAAATSTG